MTRVPKYIYVIFDSLDGPNIFRSEKEAVKIYQKWQREAKDKTWDSFWDMSEVMKYKIEGALTKTP